MASNKNAQISNNFSVSLSPSIPIQIDFLDDLEISSEIIFSHSAETSYYFYPEYSENATPLEVRYFLTLADGVEINSPKAVCYYIEPDFQ